ncbi:MAG TPA: AmmeMemoRadiSam system protein A [Gammaproteobacteria bacterium]
MSSIDATLDAASRATLLQVARESIACGVRQGRPLTVDADYYPPTLRIPRATFVTLQKDGELRGCIGTLEAHRPLVEDVAMNAFNAAFRDPRFAPLHAEELHCLDIHISVLSPSEPMRFQNEADLLSQLRPGVDGLILSAPGHRGTFLPSVWESLSRPEEFLRHLKHKAGLPADHWSPEIHVERYTTETF